MHGRARATGGARGLEGALPALPHAARHDVDRGDTGRAPTADPRVVPEGRRRVHAGSGTCARGAARRVPPVDGRAGAVPRGVARVLPGVGRAAGARVQHIGISARRSAVPIGRERLHAIGPYLEDRTPIRFAALLARAIGGLTEPEGYDV